MQDLYLNNWKYVRKYLICLIAESGDSNPPAANDGSFGGGPKPMLPYSSMFMFGPTNPWVLNSQLLCYLKGSNRLLEQ